MTILDSRPILAPTAELPALPTPADALTCIFDQLCADLGLDPFSAYPRYVVVIPPRQRTAETSSFRLAEPTKKDEPEGLRSAAGAGNVLGVGNADNERGPDTGPDPTTEEDTMIDANTATAAIDTAKDAEVTVTVVIGEDRVTGDPISVNTKGVNLRVDGKVRSFGLRRIDAITADVPEVDGDDIPEDGMTTADVAAMFDMEAKELRVHLRKLGLGVGKGRKYGLGADDVRAVRDHLAATAAADGNDA